jgi:hypothetical protein
MFGEHIVDCLSCKSVMLKCHDRYNGPNSCSNTQNHVCQKCKNMIRYRIQKTENLDEYHCDHVLKWSGYLGLWTITNGLSSSRICRICFGYLSEEKMRSLKKRKLEEDRIERRDESLQQKCIKLIVRDPALILIASTQYPFTVDVWKQIYSMIPSDLSLEYKEELLESKRTNNQWMYDTITKVFGFYNRIQIK